VDVPAVPVRELDGAGEQERSAVIRARVMAARSRQLERYKADRIFSNAELKPRHLKKYCALDRHGRELVEQAMTKLALSARAYGRILRVARTIADLAASDRIEALHVAEAIQYRSFDRRPDF
jgi:magnesium chelatase family protein